MALTHETMNEGCKRDYLERISVIGYPVITLPLGLDQEKLPVSIQAVGSRYKDRALLDVSGILSRLMLPVRYPFMHE